MVCNVSAITLFMHNTRLHGSKKKYYAFTFFATGPVEKDL